MLLQDETSALIPALVAGFTYVATVIAENDEGVVASQCPELALTIGNGITMHAIIYGNHSSRTYSDHPPPGPTFGPQ